MNHHSHTVLHLDLEKQTSEIKSHTDLLPFLGGYGSGLKLLEQNLDSNPLIFSIGPLTAVFPFASKTCVLAGRSRMQTSFAGGGLGAAMKFAGFDAIVINGKAASPLYILIKDQEISFHKTEGRRPWKNESLLGQVSVLESGEESLVDRYFKFSGDWLGKDLAERKLKAVAISGTKSYPSENTESYQRIFKEILSRIEEVGITASDKKSCFACPLGCERSFEGDMYLEKCLSMFLVSCHFAAKIFENIPTVFSCLNALGYSYSHEDLEKLPEKVVELEEEINEKLKIKD